jgi:hypothetical protein
MKTTRILLTMLLAIFLLAACSKATPPPSPTIEQQPIQTAYPAPFTGNLATPGYPIPVSGIPSTPASGYPAPLPTNAGSPVTVVPFRLNKPVLAGATEVSGTGPAGVPIILGDVTLYGTILGETTINADGSFLFKLSTPLEKGHRIGVALGSLEGTPWIPANFSDEGFHGEEHQLVPMVGFFYDTVMVSEN